MFPDTANDPGGQNQPGLRTSAPDKQFSLKPSTTVEQMVTLIYPSGREKREAT